MKILKDNSKNNVVKREMLPKTITTFCDNCDSELEITEEDTYIGWLGTRFITCPCCGEESMVEELEGITLTKDNIKFPVHFKRTNKDLKNVKEIDNDEIAKEINKAITYFRENKDEYSWYISYGDLFVIVFRYEEDEDYFVLVTRDFYETYIPFEEEDYE